MRNESEKYPQIITQRNETPPFSGDQMSDLEAILARFALRLHKLEQHFFDSKKIVFTLRQVCQIFNEFQYVA